jgi:hypothetical protein
MLSVKSINSGANAAAAAAYYEGYQLGAEDPRARQHDEPPGKWVGSFAEKIGIAGAAGSARRHRKIARRFSPAQRRSVIK